MADNRFAIVAGDDLEALLEGVVASNTRCTATAVNIFLEYLSGKTYRDFKTSTCSTYVLQILHRDDNYM